MQVHNPNPYHGSKGKSTSAAGNQQPVKEKKPANRKHYGNFKKRMKFNDKLDDTSPAEAYINSALGSTLTHSYSISRFGFTSRDPGMD